jgi:predicted aspartyl protease
MNPDRTRRRLLGAASALVLIPFGVRSQETGTPRLQTAGAGSREAEIVGDASSLKVDVLLNGFGPFAFIVDTGADRTIVADDLVDSARMVRGAPVVVAGVVRSTVAATASVSRLQLALIDRRNLTLPALPREMLKADGYLGLDVIDGQRVTFDFRNKLLTVAAPRSVFAANWHGAKEESVAVRGSSGHLRALDCLVDGVRATAFIDTGAEVSACNSSLLHALMRRNATQGTSGTVALSGVTGGGIQGTVTMVDRVQLGDLSFAQCPVVVADFEIFKIWGLQATPALLIGMNLLRSFAKVSIDYGRKEIHFELSDSLKPRLLFAGAA